MSQFSSTFKAGGLLLACTAFAIAFAAPARCADDEDNLPDVVLMRKILNAMGLKRDDPGIDYRERSPLVLPPSMDLPPPETKTAVDHAPNWPDDTDLRRAREEKAARAKSHTENPEDDWRVLSPDELDRGRVSRSAASRSATSQTPEQAAKASSPSALGYAGGLFDFVFDRDKTETAKFSHEPPRAALTDPPPGYQTPSPAAPYGTGKSMENTKIDLDKSLRGY